MPPRRRGSDAALRAHIEKLQIRLEKRIYPKDDLHLSQRAAALNERYFRGSLSWNSIQYSSRQEHRRGSCNCAARTILISDRLASLPQWVEDYVIVHELAHLIERGHNERFYAVMDEHLPDWRLRRRVLNGTSRPA